MKKMSVLFYDLLIVIVSYFISMWIRFDLSFTEVLGYQHLYRLLPLYITIYFISFISFKTYIGEWNDVGIDDGLKIAVSNIAATTALFFLRLLGVISGMPISVVLMIFFVNTILQESSRYLFRYYQTRLMQSNLRQSGGRRVLIYGAGNAGRLIAREILINKNMKYNLIGFIDDNDSLKKKTLDGYPVLGDRTKLFKIVNSNFIDEIIIAMPSEKNSVQKEIFQLCLKLGIQVKTVSSVENLIKGGGLNNSVQNIDIIDLLERREIKLDNDSLGTVIKDKKILVTGAGGSIGSELVRQILKVSPQKITLLDIAENQLYQIQQEVVMKQRDGGINPKINVEAFVASIRDVEAIDEIFAKGNFDVVFHAAAHKHVPLMETRPKEAIKNNIFGTKNLISAANKYHVDTFINISTDKAVNPTNVMGATKRFIEMMLISQKNENNTKFVAVRFGNVLGSNGSVVPLFKKQILNGGPVTVTDPEIVRYFMTIPEAVSLVLQTATFAQGGEIFILDMGKPVKILHLAERMIELSGFKPYDDINIEYSGLRPGEKLYEELLMSEEGIKKTDNDLIYIANPVDISESEILRKLSDLEKVTHDGVPDEEVIKCLEKSVPTFTYTKN